MENTSNQRFPNIDFLGRGFDLLLTDPLDYARSKGQRAKVIALQFNGQNRVRADGGPYDFPIGTQVKTTSGGTTALTFRQMFRASDYSSQFGESATVMGGVPAIASFSLSESFQRAFSTSSETKRSTLFLSREVRIAQINFTPPEDDPPPQVMDRDFAGAVRNLPLTPDPAYERLIEQFGTHYTTSVEMGGRAYEYTILEQSTFSRMLSTSIDVKAGASGAFEIFSASASGQFDEKNTQAYREATETSETLKNFSGGAPFEDWDSWVKSVATSPVPVAVTLEPVWALLNEANFPSDAGIETKRETLRATVEAYLRNGQYTDQATTIVPGRTRFALADRSGRFLSRVDATAQVGPVTVTNTLSDKSTWLAGADSTQTLEANRRLALRHIGNAAAMDVDLASGVYVPRMFPQSDLLRTKLISALEDPAAPVANTGGRNSGVVPREIRLGDQVFILQEGNSTLALRTADGTQPTAVTNPKGDDPSFLWTVVRVP